jgi:glycosyltransferase involved in cell wall biosynthesis
MRSAPRVSVVVPVYNGERFLGEALDSALAQDYQPLEVIVVDDGSTDGSVAVAESRELDVLKQTNQGVAAARNAGLHASAGELIAFLDQDDLWLPGKLETQVSFLLEHAEIGLVYSHAELLVEPGARLPGWLRSYADRPMPGYLPSTLLCRRVVFEAAGPFDSNYTVGSDSDWLLRVKDAGVGHLMLPDVLIRYRIHGANNMYQQPLVLREIARMFHESAVRQRSEGRLQAP